MQTTSTTLLSSALPPGLAGRVLDLEFREPLKSPVGTRSFAKDDGIYAEGDPATHYFKVLAGVVRTSTILKDGRRQIDSFHVAGELFGIERGNEHRFSAEAVGDAVVMSFRRCSLDALAARDWTLATQVVATTFESLERAQRHKVLLGRRSATEKVAAFLLDFSDRVHLDSIELPMSRIDIADYLGLTIETVSRTLTQFERNAIIELPTARRNIVLRNKSALKRLNS
jgi:CRP/FNR family nitrogen fixation transcriptional regulator